ncbi:hypothetical protein JP09_007015 [Dehalogenimonas etheniformans]|uniref:Uncharacterized protein n=2 Tax=Dehalogenimonas etheniformans TaxID=1536648 RepID=A0A2P5P6W5_9CHLR|nr:hypothetical protein JP09_007015 [Dehalogenimonas etheniformans]
MSRTKPLPQSFVILIGTLKRKTAMQTILARWLPVGITLLLIAMATSCGAGTPKTVPFSFSELIDHPALYNSRAVTVNGYYFSGFEISALASALVQSTFDPSNVTPVQPLIWITGDLGQAVYQNLMQQTNTPSGYPEKYGHVEITGLFQYGKFGHLDAYSYQITVTQAAIIP